MTALIDDIESYLRQTYLPKRSGKRAMEAFAYGAGEVSLAFTADRPDLPKNYFNKPEFRSGYLLYFVASNVPKVLQVLRSCKLGERFADQVELNILDLGCGPGTGAIAAAEYWQELEGDQRLNILGVDQNKKILNDAKGLFSTRDYLRARLRTMAADVGPGKLGGILKTQRYDVIICSNLLNEYARDEDRFRITTNLLKRYLTKRGVLIIIEPALQYSTRQLMELRDELLAEAHARIVAPCLHQANCPMLAHNKRDWCHSYLQWQRPPLIAEVDKLIGNKKDFLKFSYLVLERPDAPAAEKSKASRYRVVSARLPSKGRSQLLLCPDDSKPVNSLRKIERLDRDVSPSNADYDHSVRGDIVEISDKDRIGKTDTFRITHAFQPDRKRARPAKAKRRTQ